MTNSRLVQKMRIGLKIINSSFTLRDRKQPEGHEETAWLRKRSTTDTVQGQEPHHWPKQLHF